MNNGNEFLYNQLIKLGDMMGDWNLCCSKKSGLCYENTEACELFAPEELERMKEDEKDNI